MLRTLLKKQLIELNQNFFYDRKKGKGHSRLTSWLLIALYAFIMVFIIGGIFAALSSSLCGVLVNGGMGWLYFTILSLLAIMLGVFGSVFSTSAGLYQARDNDLLLSLPIPVRFIMAARLLGVYLMGLMFSAVVMAPAIIVYFTVVPITVSALIGSATLLIIVSLIVLILACILGWVVAKISRKLKNKSFISVLISIAFLVGYYVFYFNATQILQSLIINMQTVGSSVKGGAYPLYLLGRMGEGDIAALLIISATVFALLLLTCCILSRSFIKIASGASETAKVKYSAGAVRIKSISGALLAKELRRFTSSANYMLNCGFGILFILAAAVLLLVKAEWLRSLLQSVSVGADPAAVFLAGGICLLASTNDMTAASVSLEGKNLWILRSLPVEAWQALKAKLHMQLLLTGGPVILCGVCCIIALRPSFSVGLMLILLISLYTVLSACFGLFLNLKNPNLSWSSEIVPIKQSISVMLAIFGGWGYAIALVSAFLLTGRTLGTMAYFALAAAITAILIALLYNWIRKKGVKAFEEL